MKDILILKFVKRLLTHVIVVARLVLEVQIINVLSAISILL